MTKEEIKAAEEKVKADAAAKEAEEAEKAKATEEEEDGSSKKEEKIDYEAELEAERQRGKPDPKKAADAFKERKAKKVEEDITIEDDEDDEDKPLTKKDLDNVLAGERERLQKEINAERIDEIANSLASTPSEAKLIVEIHKNRSFPANLSLREQLEEAHAIANRKKLISLNSELARAARGRDTVSKDNATTYRDEQPGTTPKMSAQDTESYKRAGFTYDVKDRLWKKKLPTGKTLIKDPKTKQMRVI